MDFLLPTPRCCSVGPSPSTSTMISTASSNEDHQQTNRTASQGTRHCHHHHHQGKMVAKEEVEKCDEQEELEEEGYSFFESLERVPSNVSYVVDLSDDSEEDDSRTSFASAIATPSETRCVNFVRNDPFAEHQKGRLGEVKSGFDYEIWTADPEPTSIMERRRRLLQGMGFASNKDLAAAMQSRSMKATGSRDTGNDVHNSPAPPPHRPAVARCQSDAHMLARKLPPKPPATAALPRTTSAPSTLCNYLERQRPGNSGSTGTEGTEQGDGFVLSPSEDLQIKNVDMGKEFVASENGNWRLNDLQTGLQVTTDEFEKPLGQSPIDQELMRRANMEDSLEQEIRCMVIPSPGNAKISRSGYNRKGGWFKNIKFVASSVTGRTTEKEEMGEAGSKIAGKSSGEGSLELLKVHQHGKSYKELSGLYMTQEIHAHKGSIWTIKFSWDSRYMASAGEDRVIRVWQVQESDSHSKPLRSQEARSPGQFRADQSPDSLPIHGNQFSKRTKKYKSNKKSFPDYIVMPDVIFSLSEKPICSFKGHLDDVLDLSWSKSQLLLSSSMDKTVRLWDLESKTCLKLFAHSDFVTCIQFNPVDDRYFISGSLDAKLRIWSIPEHQVVDWSELHEMVTAACYTPDGQAAVVGSHKGSFRRYKTSACKISQESQIEIRKKKSHHAKKITGFQFAPGYPFEVLITSADSRIRVFNGPKMNHKFRGFRNTNSQISASYTLDGKFIICASEDSHVYVWNREAARATSSGGKNNKGWTTTRSHECFYCKDVSAAIPWPSAVGNCSPFLLPPLSGRFNSEVPPDSQRSTSSPEDSFRSNRSQDPPLQKKSISEKTLSEEFSNLSYSGMGIGSESFASSRNSLQRGAVPPSLSESCAMPSSSSRRWHNGGSSWTSNPGPSCAWGLVVVTASLGGDIRIFQNFGVPLRFSR